MSLFKKINVHILFQGISDFMNIINKKTVVVSTSNELKDVLEKDNRYEYIYLDNDITLESGITINKNKSKITINGTYKDILHTLIGMDSLDSTDTIICSSSTKEAKIKNIKIINTNIHDVIYVPIEDSYEDIITIYENIIFNGTKLSLNTYGVVKINNSTITIQATNNVEPQEVCEATYVIIGGKTNIFSSSLNFPLFLFSEKSLNPYVVFLCKSDIILSIESREFMSGTNKLNFTILHDTKVHLTTGNGFSSESNYGANNVLIDERASSIFIEKKYRTIPMWGIFGTLTVKEDSKLQLINLYNNTPSDNYNIHFKGTDCQMFIENPKNLVLYSKNSNVIYTDNLLNFNIKCSRINMWLNSTDISFAGDINDLPNYSWYKESKLT